MPDPYRLSAADLAKILIPDAPLVPELEKASRQLATFCSQAQVKHVLSQTEALMPDIRQLPQTSYTHYRFYQRNGDRESYQQPYFAKRTQLAAAALRLWLGLAENYPDSEAVDYPTSLKDVVQDHLWSICEESSWVLPAHERTAIDLFSAETSFLLAELLTLLGDEVDGEVKMRVRREIEQRTLEPYLKHHDSHWWYRGHNNWNGVCNSSVMASFLHLWPSTDTVAQALEICLQGLEVFLKTAFEADGSSTEGVAYWHYGLINFVSLAEMLHAVSGGALNLLASDHLRKVAAYPAKMQLSGSWFASFSDCDETVTFNPGIIQRFAERSGEASLYSLLAKPAEIGSDWRLTMMLRNMLWWNGEQADQAPNEDAVLSEGGTAKLVVERSQGGPVIVAIKAGHNAENHNQNDVGSFLIHVAGENLLTDPGRGLYSRAYFSAQRYENIFANSYGHSLPRIAGQLQQVGSQFVGELLSTDLTGPLKKVQVDIARAYAEPSLNRLIRQLSVATTAEKVGTLWLEDLFEFSGPGLPVEEAFVTWHEVQLEGSGALIQASECALRLTIEEPTGLGFTLERLEAESKQNKREGILKRLAIILPAQPERLVRLRLELI